MLPWPLFVYLAFGALVACVFLRHGPRGRHEWLSVAFWTVLWPLLSIAAIFMLAMAGSFYLLDTVAARGRASAKPIFPFELRSWEYWAHALAGIVFAVSIIVVS